MTRITTCRPFWVNYGVKQWKTQFSFYFERDSVTLYADVYDHSVHGAQWLARISMARCLARISMARWLARISMARWLARISMARWLVRISMARWLARISMARWLARISMARSHTVNSSVKFWNIVWTPKCNRYWTRLCVSSFYIKIKCFNWVKHLSTLFLGRVSNNMWLCGSMLDVYLYQCITK